MKHLSQHVLDILENSVRAKATEVTLQIIDSKTENILSFNFIDNGCGMDKEKAQAVLDPFVTSRTTRKIGLGLPLFKQNAERSQGDLEIQSEVGVGTVVKAWFVRDNIDVPPMGDLAGSLVQLIISYPEINFIYKHTTDEGDFEISSNELMPIICENGRPVLGMINPVIEMMQTNLKELKAFD